jgi:hypothetical protein
MRPSGLRKPQRQACATVTVPAPVGGLNTVQAGGEMPPEDAVLTQNLVASDNGSRVRLGWQEWCTGLSSNVVRSTLAYTGKATANSRLFAATTDKIYDVSSSSAAPSTALTFATSTTDSGWGVSCVVLTAGGHYLLYADEENGLHLYKESTDTWAAYEVKATNAWTNGHAYVLGDRVLNDTGKTYRCITAGTSAGSGGPTGTAADITDNTAHWKYIEAVLDGVDPATIVHVTSWKNRIWLTQKATAKAWYLATGAVFGAATGFQFGQQFRGGGALVGLWSATLDGGTGADDYLVGVSFGGDVVVYQGTDPSTADAFGLKGTWTVGAVPTTGRGFVSQFGGDLLIVAATGLRKLSELMSGQVTDSTQYLTGKVANVFNYYVNTFGSVRGWGLIIHPEDNALMVLIPQSTGVATLQLVMSLSRKSWGLYTGLPIHSAASWGGTLYFGTVDGRVCRNTGYVDGALLDMTAAVTSPIQFGYVSSFQNQGNAAQKQIGLIRPVVISQGSPPTLECSARYDWDLDALSPVAAATGSATTGWDASVWDVSTWGGAYTASDTTSGATGMGVSVAICVTGAATSRTVLTGVEITYTQGGFL